MPSFASFAGLAATASVLLPNIAAAFSFNATSNTTAAPAFNALSNTNVAVYWGQGANQPRLAEFCHTTSIDIINLAFLNVFPEQGPGGYPGTNFGNACGSETYTRNGVSTDLLSNCPTIGADIKTCQAAGKKIFLSVGGGYPANYWLATEQSAVDFADFLWGAFGPETETWTHEGFPRPFGDARVDGFDLDIESIISPGGNATHGAVPVDYKSRGYATLASILKEEYYPRDNSKNYYLSASPQCVVPDAHLAAAIEESWFDFLFVQFYNTPQCSARAGVNKFKKANSTATGNSTNDITFGEWVAAPSKNPDVKVFLGLPGSPTSTIDPSYYITPEELALLIEETLHPYPTRFGGIMLWEATSALNNKFGNVSYYDIAKYELVGCLTDLPAGCTSTNCTASSPVIPTNGTSSPQRVSSTPPFISSSAAPFGNLTASATRSSSILAPTADPVRTSSSLGSANRTSGADPSITSSDILVTSTIWATDVVTITRCAASVTNCPARTSVTSYPVSTTVITLAASSAKPSNVSSSDPGVTVTDITTVYTTICPITATLSANGTTTVVTSTGVSTVTATVKATITKSVRCSSCAVTSSVATGDPIAFSVSASKNSSTATSSVSTGDPIASSVSGSKNSSTAVVYTTVVVYTSTTVCPAGQTVTSGTVTSVLSADSTSIVTRTITDTVTCTDPACVASATKASSSLASSTTGSVYTTTFTAGQTLVSGASTTVLTSDITSVITLTRTATVTCTDPACLASATTTSSADPAASSTSSSFASPVKGSVFTTTFTAGQTLVSGSSTTVLTSDITSVITLTRTATVTCTDPACLASATKASSADPAATTTPSSSASPVKESIYTTTFTAGQTLTSGTSTTVLTSDITSIITSTRTATVTCTDPACVVSASALTGSATRSSDPADPQNSSSVSTKYTTELVYTTTTVCPAGQTITSGTMTTVLASDVTSVITRTRTEVITCTDPACVAKSSTPAAATGSPGVASASAASTSADPTASSKKSASASSKSTSALSSASTPVDPAASSSAFVSSKPTSASSPASTPVDPAASSSASVSLKSALASSPASTPVDPAASSSASASNSPSTLTPTQLLTRIQTATITAVTSTSTGASIVRQTQTITASVVLYTGAAAPRNVGAGAAAAAVVVAGGFAVMGML